MKSTTRLLTIVLTLFLIKIDQTISQDEAPYGDGPSSSAGNKKSFGTSENKNTGSTGHELPSSSAGQQAPASGQTKTNRDGSRALLRTVGDPIIKPKSKDFKSDDIYGQIEDTKPPKEYYEVPQASNDESGQPIGRTLTEIKPKIGATDVASSDELSDSKVLGNVAHVRLKETIPKV